MACLLAVLGCAGGPSIAYSDKSTWQYWDKHGARRFGDSEAIRRFRHQTTVKRVHSLQPPLKWRLKLGLRARGSSINVSESFSEPMQPLLTKRVTCCHACPPAPVIGARWWMEVGICRAVGAPVPAVRTVFVLPQALGPYLQLCIQRNNHWGEWGFQMSCCMFLP